jgi:hypothetical protein
MSVNVHENRFRNSQIFTTGSFEMEAGSGTWRNSGVNFYQILITPDLLTRIMIRFDII